ncbi:MAG: hypothetical protein JXR22_08625 [Prolixibacteraceae bacterium]|nr:hypothetical protein [Prolixibacteraceae bacterium]
MMTLKNAINLFRRLTAETTSKSEIKVYQDFMKILTNLEKRNLAEPEVESLEKKLDDLELNRTLTNSKKHFKKALQQLKKYLEETFSIISKGDYIIKGITIGATAGLLLGIVFLSGLERSLGISLGISAGTFIGMIIATYMEAQAKAAGNLIG